MEMTNETALVLTSLGLVYFIVLGAVTLWITKP